MSSSSNIKFSACTLVESWKERKLHRYIEGCCGANGIMYVFMYLCIYVNFSYALIPSTSNFAVKR